MAADKVPWGLPWRSNTTFIIATVAIGLFTDLFLYGLVVPVLPFMLRERISIPENEIQSYVSGLLAAYAGAQLLASLPVGWIADRTASRQMPFLSGLLALLLATIMLAVGRSKSVLIVARILQGISAAVVWTIGLAVVMDTVGPKDMGKVIGTIFSFISVGELLAPVLGGVLYDKSGYLGVFGVALGVLALDLIMRLLMIEKKTAAKYNSVSPDEAPNPRNLESRGDETQEADEEDPLLPGKQEEWYKIKDEPNPATRAFPILYCLRNPRLLMALSLAFVQASLLATFDATIPTEAEELFNFSSLQAGLLFVALDIPYLILGPIAGWSVDKYGTKPAATIGFAYLVATLVLLRVPSAELLHGSRNITLYCGILALNGVGLAVIGSPAIVEASDVVQKYDKANPNYFGKNGPYAQLYGFNSLFFCAGLTIGPVLSGVLRDTTGYGNMNLVFAAVSGITAVLSFLIIGGKPKLRMGWTR